MNKNNLKRMVIISIMLVISITYVGGTRKNREIGESIQVTTLPVSGKIVILDAGHGTPDERNSLLTLKNNIDLLQKIKCFKHFIFFMLKRRLIYAKQRIW